MAKQRYFDYASTTPLDKKVLSAMLPYLQNEFGNPSNLYSLGRRASSAVKKSTDIIADILGCKSDEFVYTGSATEADNLAILGVARGNKDKGNKIIVSEIEHKGILAVCDALAKEGCPGGDSRRFEIAKIPVQKNGLIDLEALKREIDDRTVLVSVTMADSETGTIQPISEISKIIRGSRLVARDSLPYFHTDASQAAGYLDINVDKLGVDLMTLSAHKLHGPKGIGGLYVRRGVNISPIIFGGGQQKRIRSGTPNVAAIAGFAEALKISRKNIKTGSSKVKRMRDALERGILKSITKVIINGHRQKRLPNFLNISILDVEGESLLLYLDELGIVINTGSACNSQTLEPSYILSALGNPYEYIHGSVRFSLGKENTMEDVKYVLKHLPQAVKKLREISPLNLKLEQTKDISDPRAFVGGQTPHFIRKKYAKKS